MTVSVMVISGTLKRNVVVTLTTDGGTAVCELYRVGSTKSSFNYSFTLLSFLLPYGALV